MNQDNTIKVGRALPGAGVQSSVSDQKFDYSNLIGKKATLMGCGENISLDAQLPRKGTFQRQIKLSDWGEDWLVLEFDMTLEYKNKTYDYTLIRSRWVGTPIGSEFCPVFVLLDPELSLINMADWSSKNFDFASWGQVSVES